MVFNIDDLKIKICAGLLFSAWFWLVYGLCDYISHFLTNKHDVTIKLDYEIPFIPFFAFFYMLITPLLMLPTFASKNISDCLASNFVLATSVLLAGITFIVFPVLPIETPIGHQDKILQLADFVNLKYNMLPSLHVTLAMIIGLIYGPQFNAIGRLILWTVILLIVLSTLLTKQHYVADVISGILLSLVCVWVFLNPAKKWFSSRLE